MPMVLALEPTFLQACGCQMLRRGKNEESRGFEGRGVRNRLWVVLGVRGGRGTGTKRREKDGERVWRATSCYFFALLCAIYYFLFYTYLLRKNKCILINSEKPGKNGCKSCKKGCGCGCKKLQKLQKRVWVQRLQLLLPYSCLPYRPF